MKQAAQVQPKAAKGQENSPLMELFIEELKDIYWAEQHLVKALPKMAAAATSAQLKKAFKDHLSVTEIQVERLVNVFELLGKKPEGKKCEAMSGLVKEAEELMEDTKDKATRDVALIMSAQKVEHYEIATYGSLRTIATQLGLKEASKLFQKTLNEEGEADQALTEIAEFSVNERASAK
jgi:ferritin-like metal-binding protein YciE